MVQKAFASSAFAEMSSFVRAPLRDVNGLSHFCERAAGKAAAEKEVAEKAVDVNAAVEMSREKIAETKAAEAPAAKAKARLEAKAAEAKAVVAKAAEAKAAEAKVTVEAKAAEAKVAEAKPKGGAKARVEVGEVVTSSQSKSGGEGERNPGCGSVATKARRARRALRKAEAHTTSLDGSHLTGGGGLEGCALDSGGGSGGGGSGGGGSGGGGSGGGSVAEAGAKLPPKLPPAPAWLLLQSLPPYTPIPDLSPPNEHGSDTASLEGGIVMDTHASRNYHLQILADELKARSWKPLHCSVNGKAVYVVARIRKAFKPFTLEGILQRTTALGSMSADGDKTIDEVVNEFILREYTELIPCGAHITRKVSSIEQQTAQPLTDRAALERVLELDAELKALRQSFRKSQKPHEKTKLLLEPDAMQAVGGTERDIATAGGRRELKWEGGQYKLQCRTRTSGGDYQDARHQDGNIPLRKAICRAIKMATEAFVEDHSLDHRASASTVHAMQGVEFGELLRQRLSESADDAS